ncbi:hypothetical protein [Streptomyces sp. URMC 123]
MATAVMDGELTEEEPPVGPVGRPVIRPALRLAGDEDDDGSESHICRGID